MDGVIGPLLLVIAIAVVVVLAIAMSVRRVQPDERIVVFRLGRTNESLVLGPGWVFLVPIVDRPVTVGLRPEQLVLEHLPGVTSDGRDIGVDLELAYRVDQPLMFVVMTVMPAELGLRGLARKTIATVATGMTAGDVLETGRLEDALRPPIEEALAKRGCADVVVRVRRVRALRVVDEDERLTRALLKAARLPTDLARSG
jgi:regulator of protease activity HflC (stomatin/prohibitin superfamily)